MGDGIQDARLNGVEQVRQKHDNMKSAWYFFGVYLEVFFFVSHQVHEQKRISYNAIVWQKRIVHYRQFRDSTKRLRDWSQETSRWCLIEIHKWTSVSKSDSEDIDGHN